MANLQKIQSAPQRAKPSRPALAAKPGAKAVGTDLIAARAYEIWEKNGCVEGSEQENWYQAERELAEAHDE